MERRLTAGLWLQLEPGGPAWQRRLRIARTSARRPRTRIPGTYLAHLTVTLPEAIFDREGEAVIELDPGMVAGPPQVAQEPAGETPW